MNIKNNALIVTLSLTRAALAAFISILLLACTTTYKHEELRNSDERLERERLKLEQQQSEQQQSEQQQSEQQQSEQLQSEQREPARQEKEQLKKEEFKKEQIELETFETEQLEVEKLEAEKLDAVNLEPEKPAPEALVSEELASEELALKEPVLEKTESETPQTEPLESEPLSQKPEQRDPKTDQERNQKTGLPEQGEPQALPNPEVFNTAAPKDQVKEQIADHVNEPLDGPELDKHPDEASPETSIKTMTEAQALTKKWSVDAAKESAAPPNEFDDKDEPLREGVGDGRVDIQFAEPGLGIAEEGDGRILNARPSVKWNLQRRPSSSN